MEYKIPEHPGITFPAIVAGRWFHIGKWQAVAEVQGMVDETVEGTGGRPER